MSFYCGVTFKMYMLLISSRWLNRKVYTLISNDCIWYSRHMLYIFVFIVLAFDILKYIVFVLAWLLIFLFKIIFSLWNKIWICTSIPNPKSSMVFFFFYTTCAGSLNLQWLSDKNIIIKAIFGQNKIAF